MRNYVKIRFGIRSGYEYGEGWKSIMEKIIFEEEIENIFLANGWALKPARMSCECNTVVKGEAHLYLHPMEITGCVEEEDIPAISKWLEAPHESFKLLDVKTFEKVYDITDEEYIEYLESRQDEIKAYAKQFLKYEKVSAGTEYLHLLKVTIESFLTMVWRSWTRYHSMTLSLGNDCKYSFSF